MSRTAGTQPKPKTGAGFERVVLSLFFPKLARLEVLKYLVSFLWNVSGASAELNALARASKDCKSFRSGEKPHGSVCPPFWIHTVEWSGAGSCLWWHHRFQIAWFSPSTLENSVFNIFQIAPLWRAFSNGSFLVIVFGWSCSVADSRIRSKTAPFSFEKR